jgi:hypothetical protein
MTNNTTGWREWDKLESVSIAPGYADIGLNLVLSDGRKIQVNLHPADVRQLLNELQTVNRHAWPEEWNKTEPGRAGKIVWDR